MTKDFIIRILSYNTDKTKVFVQWNDHTINLIPIELLNPMNENYKFNHQKPSKEPEKKPFYHGISESSWKSLMNLRYKLSYNNTKDDWFFEN